MLLSDGWLKKLTSAFVEAGLAHCKSRSGTVFVQRLCGTPDVEVDTSQTLSSRCSSIWPATDKLRFAYRYLGIGATVRGLHAVAGGCARCMRTVSWTDSDESWSDACQQCMAARRAVIALQSRVSVYIVICWGEHCLGTS